MKLPRLSMMGHAVAQTGLTALQVGQAASGLVPFPWNIAVHAGIGITQGLIALHHHTSPPTDETDSK
jgi:hypothetical protein